MGTTKIKADVDMSAMSKELNGMIKRRVFRISWKKLLVLILAFLMVMSAMAFFGWYMFKENQKRYAKLLTIKSALTENIYTASSRAPYSMCSNVVTESMNTDYPLFVLALGSRSGYIQGWSSEHAIGLCAIPVGYIEQLINAGIIGDKKDLYDYKINIKAAEYVWKELWDASGGDINASLENYLFKDDPGSLKLILDRYWKFIFIIEHNK